GNGVEELDGEPFGRPGRRVLALGRLGGDEEKSQDPDGGTERRPSHRVIRCPWRTKCNPPLGTRRRFPFRRRSARFACGAALASGVAVAVLDIHEPGSEAADPRPTAAVGPGTPVSGRMGLGDRGGPGGELQRPRLQTKQKKTGEG